MTTKKLIYLAIAGVVIYLVWQKFLKKETSVDSNTPKPVVLTTKPMSQGDVVNDLSFAKSNY